MSKLTDGSYQARLHEMLTEAAAGLQWGEEHVANGVQIPTEPDAHRALVVPMFGKVAELAFAVIPAQLLAVGVQSWADLNPADTRALTIVGQNTGNQGGGFGTSHIGYMLPGSYGFGSRSGNGDDLKNTLVDPEAPLHCFSAMTRARTHGAGLWGSEPRVKQFQQPCLELFSAVWSGDRDQLAKLCAADCHGDSTAALLTSSDLLGNTPLSIALGRGHHDCATFILETVNSRFAESAGLRSKKKTDDAAKQNINNFDLAGVLGNSNDGSITAGLQAAMLPTETEGDGSDNASIGTHDVNLSAMSEVAMLSRLPAQTLLGQRTQVPTAQLPKLAAWMSAKFPDDHPSTLAFLTMTPVMQSICTQDVAGLKLLLDFCDVVVDGETAAPTTSPVGTYAQELLGGMIAAGHRVNYHEPQDAYSPLKPIQVALVLGHFDVVACMLATCGGGLEYSNLETEEMRKGKAGVYTSLGGDAISADLMNGGGEAGGATGPLLSMNMSLAHTAAVYATDTSVLEFAIEGCTEPIRTLAANRKGSTCAEIINAVSVESTVRYFCGLERRDNAGKTVFHHAIEHGNQLALDQLLSIDAARALIDAVQTDKDGNNIEYGDTPLQLALSKSDFAAVGALLKAGADPRIAHGCQKQNILHMAGALQPEADALKMLELIGASLDEAVVIELLAGADADGRVPYLGAIASGRTTIAAAVQERTAGPIESLRDSQGRNVFHFAALLRRKAMAEEMLNSPALPAAGVAASLEDANGATPFDLSLQSAAHNRSQRGTGNRSGGFGGGLFGMSAGGRTMQTARVSTGGKAPRTLLASMPGPGMPGVKAVPATPMLDAYECAELFGNLPGSRGQIDFDSVQQLALLRSKNAVTSTTHHGGGNHGGHFGYGRVLPDAGELFTTGMMIPGVGSMTFDALSSTGSRRGYHY